MPNPLAFLAESSVAVKIAAFFLAWIIIWLPIAIPLAIALQWHPPKPLQTEQKLPLVLSLYVLAPLVLWGAAQIDNLPFSDYGITWESSFLVSLAIGLGLGLGGLVFLFGIESWLDWLDWQWENWRQIIRFLLPLLVVGLLVSIIEELVFRGFLLNQLQQAFHPWIAALSSSLIFALLHLVWEGKEALPQLPGLWLMGMVLVVARWVDGGSLGLAIGLHAGWIWGMASLDSAQLIHYKPHSPDWMIGRSGKPLAGGMSLLMLLATALALWNL
ncbi:CPBP family intramembrane metalloprotease [Kovacikia minuta CCNUW1]|uniref:CPBP family intramembrane glutamic endopeptidase n=1 Tax=Kovacikia minuta TaxID=2931930 RepID=UPI001CCE6F3C|nr:type II CAAX endopeptidase family protein [Kovacikia minuta]UBF29137.1 CPBP family intramembrane metalloprotease [Kovacikia minuta CCNUW1]